MQREFFSILKERSRRGVTIFLSSHVLSEIQRNCSRAAVIREGRIIACGSVEDLARTNAKRVSVTGLVDLKGLAGVRDLQTGERSASFLYNGNLNDLLLKLYVGQVKDLSISDPDLEEIFRHYYEKEGDGHDHPEA